MTQLPPLWLAIQSRFVLAESDAGGASKGVIAMFEKILIDLAALATIASFALAVVKEWKARADDEGEKRNRR